jgi:hypothetical protein
MGRRYHIDCPRPNASLIHRRRRLAKLRAYKLARGCDLCGYNRCANSLDFHHTDPTTKKHRVWVPEGTEFEKCKLLCKNCHYELEEKIKENGDLF